MYTFNSKIPLGEGGGEHLNAGEDQEQLQRKMGQLEHHASTLCTPALLPVVQAVRDEPPADADERVLGHHLLACIVSPLSKEDYLYL